jgi:hypothetical protein
VSNLIDHAERELALLGNDEAMNQGILAMVAVFSTMGHSGSSAEYTTQVLARLLRYENLSPLTDDPEEWNLISEGMMPEGSEPTWQCRRNPEAFSHDGGETYYLLSERFKDGGDVKVFHRAKHVEPKPLIELSTPSPEPIHEAECSITKWGWREPCTCRPATMMQPVDIALDDEQPATRELTGQFTIGQTGWTCTIDGCDASYLSGDTWIDHLTTHGIETIEVMGVPIPPRIDKDEHEVLVHEPQCAVAMNPGLMSAWMFCHCQPVKE